MPASSDTDYLDVYSSGLSNFLTVAIKDILFDPRKVL